jgi:hypothetical protein
MGKLMSCYLTNELKQDENTRTMELVSLEVTFCRIFKPAASVRYGAGSPLLCVTYCR